MTVRHQAAFWPIGTRKTAMLVFDSKMLEGGLEPPRMLPQSEAVQQDAKTAAKPLPYSLPCKTEIDPDLARLIDAWPDLAANVKRMILAALEAGG
jgi:hypothetical protein